MLYNRTAPSRVETAYDVRGPTVRGAIATTSPLYCTALFCEQVHTTGASTSTPLVIDMAKFADGTARVEWIRGGVFVKVKFPMAARFAQRLDSSTSTATGVVHVSSTDGRVVAAGEVIEIVVDEDFRYLEVLALDTSATYVEHFKAQIPNKALALSDS